MGNHTGNKMDFVISQGEIVEGLQESSKNNAPEWKQHEKQSIQSSNIYSATPSTPATDLAIKAMSAGAEIADLPQRNRSVSHGSAITVAANGAARQITYTSKKTEVVLELPNIDLICGSNKGAKKLYRFFLTEGFTRCLNNGVLERTSFSFNLQDLVDLGIYTTADSARHTLDDNSALLAGLAIRQSIRKNAKQKAVTSAAAAPLFSLIERNGTTCTVYLNDKINWEALSSSYSYLPKMAYCLSNNAYDLVEGITYLARQNMQNVKEDGSFNISLRAVHERLWLPDPQKSNNPKRDIKGAIQKAIDDILRNDNGKCYKALELLPEGIESKNIKEYLDKGYLKVTLSDGYRDPFTSMEGKKEKAIAQTAAKVEKAKQRKIEATAKAELQHKLAQLKKQQAAAKSEVDNASKEESDI